MLEANNNHAVVSEVGASSNYVKIERPYAMLYGKGGQFDGNIYTDIFRFWIYHFVKLTSSHLFGIRYKKQSNERPAAGKVLFVTRDWGTETTLNREILRSLKEYCGSDSVEQLVLRRHEEMVSSITAAINEKKVTHILLDTRVTITGPNFLAVIKALYSSYKLSCLLKQRGVVALCGVTDWIAPGNRLLAELVTSLGGVALSWGSVGLHEVPNFRHHRRIGPLIAPTSLATMSELDHKSIKDLEYDIAIIGDNYEPRRSLINNLLPNLKKYNLKYYLNTKKDLPYLEYLRIYKGSKIGLNTNWVAGKPDKYHFVGRNFEVMLAGSLLLTQKCYGLDLYVQEGDDYICFENDQDLLDKIRYYLTNEEARSKIAMSGQKKVLELLSTQFVWMEVDKALYTFHYPKLPRKTT